MIQEILKNYQNNVDTNNQENNYLLYLLKHDITIQDILNHPLTIQHFRINSTELQTFMTQSRFQSILNYIIILPSIQDTDDTKYKYPCLSNEILSLSSQIVWDSFLPNIEQFLNYPSTDEVFVNHISNVSGIKQINSLLIAKQCKLTILIFECIKQSKFNELTLNYMISILTNLLNGKPHIFLPLFFMNYTSFLTLLLGLNQYYGLVEFIMNVLTKAVTGKLTKQIEQRQKDFTVLILEKMYQNKIINSDVFSHQKRKQMKFQTELIVSLFDKYPNSVSDFLAFRFQGKIVQTIELIEKNQMSDEYATILYFFLKYVQKVKSDKKYFFECTKSILEEEFHVLFDQITKIQKTSGIIKILEILLLLYQDFDLGHILKEYLTNNKPLDSYYFNKHLHGKTFEFNNTFQMHFNNFILFQLNALTIKLISTNLVAQNKCLDVFVQLALKLDQIYDQLQDPVNKALQDENKVQMKLWDKVRNDQLPYYKKISNLKLGSGEYQILFPTSNQNQVKYENNQDEELKLIDLDD